MSMVKVKTSELIGPALDWAVATAEGISIHALCAGGFAVNCEDYSPSTDWIQGGPLIERYRVVCDYGRPLSDGESPRWFAQCWSPYAGEYGATPLIAACRAIVAAKLGNEVQVPAELVQEVSGGK